MAGKSVDFLVDMMKYRSATTAVAREVTKQGSRDGILHSSIDESGPPQQCSHREFTQEVRDDPPAEISSNDDAKMFGCEYDFATSHAEFCWNHDSRPNYNTYGAPPSGQVYDPPPTQWSPAHSSNASFSYDIPQQRPPYNSPRQFHEYSTVEQQRLLDELNHLNVGTFDEGSEHSCLGDFGQYVKSLFCRMNSLTTRRKGHRLTPLRDAVGVATRDGTILELALREQLIEIKSQRQEMEDRLLREIAKEYSEKEHREAQLQSRLLELTEQRVEMEIQLGNLDIDKMMDRGHRPMKENIPTMMCASPFHHCAGISMGDVVDAPFEMEVIPFAETDKENVVFKPCLQVNTPDFFADKSKLPFSPTHHYSPQNSLRVSAKNGTQSTTKSPTFFEETKEITERIKPMVPKASRRVRGELSVVMEERPAFIPKDSRIHSSTCDVDVE